MNINKNLRVAVNMNPTRNTRNLTVENLCNMIGDGTLTIPLYQRDVSWTKQKCVDLLNYELLGKSPISAISVNVINNTKSDFVVPQVSFIDREVMSNMVRGQFSVVDGQQRLTTNYKAFCDNEDLRDIVLDLGSGKFVITTETIRNNQVPVGVLMNKDSGKLITYVQSKRGMDNDVMAFLLLARTKILSYAYTINMAEDLSEDEQITWFEVLNNAGSRVSIIQMRFAKMKAHGLDIYTQYTNIYRNKLQEFGYDFFTPQKTTVSYPIAALNPAYEILCSGSIHQNNFAPMPSDTKENQLCNLEIEKLRDCINLTLEALERVLYFIVENDLKQPDRVDYINYLIGYFVFNSDPMTEEQKNKVITWYNTVNFKNKSNTDRRNIYTELLNEI
mgnify:CR=1 FL=1